MDILLIIAFLFTLILFILELNNYKKAKKKRWSKGGADVYKLNFKNDFLRRMKNDFKI